jgi:hypothetical protein
VEPEQSRGFAAGHAHVPEVEQVALVSQTFPHAPQCVVLFATHANPGPQRPLRHVMPPLQSIGFAAGHPHALPAQVALVSHAAPQAPQLAALVVVLTQTPLHRVFALPQAPAQTPCTQ